MKNLRMLTLMLLTGLLFNCGGKDDDATPNNTQDCEARFDKLASAAQTFAANPTEANCEAYKKAAEDYVDKAQSCGARAVDVEAARDAIRDTDC